MNSDEVKQSTALISKHFGIEQNEFFDENEIEFSALKLKKQLCRIISYLLDKDMTRLLNGLYRIDVDEEKFKEVLYQSPPEKVTENIADLIIDRELKKVWYRKKYS